MKSEQVAGFVSESMAGFIGIRRQTLHHSEGTSGGQVKALERENRELRQANEILRKASAYFAMAELDRRPK